ncbi:protein of unknown function (plasmid) [Ralstonia solanacearum PSI07]|nr:protein of unknown function [Ralstonia solanacearum PSI07]
MPNSNGQRFERPTAYSINSLDPEERSSDWRVLSVSACERRLAMERNTELEILIDADY